MIKVDNDILYSQKDIAIAFNNFFTNIGPNLAKKISHTPTGFESYLTKFDQTINNEDLTLKEFETAFKSLKRNKAEGIDGINGNIVLEVYNEIKTILFRVFKSSLQQGVVPDLLKVAKVTPIFKSGDLTVLSNYRPISVLPAFSKILERIMYNRIYNHLISINSLFDKQFGFQKNHSTEHAILQLVRNITKSFECLKHSTLLIQGVHTVIISKIPDFPDFFLTNLTHFS